jgi:hypothetical protein
MGKGPEQQNGAPDEDVLLNINPKKFEKKKD